MTLVRMTATEATRKGFSHVSHTAGQQPVLVTNHGKPEAVVVGPAEFEEFARRLRALEDVVLGKAADTVADRSGFATVDQAKERLAAARSKR